MADVLATLPPQQSTGVTVLTHNYGEAGALARYGHGPAVFSGHNSLGEWWPPPEDALVTVVVGYDAGTLRRWFGGCEQVASIDNGIGLPNSGQGRPVWVCRDRLAPWALLWPQIRRVG